ncbi:hypothetical protein KFK09_023807 [Dendrobium nobile]|uniref:Uncharacterized protein n=1 Tax=Dendrobium nobile TaxID=94219 RepID=A0A8T3AC95_DENNO|nr:hypothetical protein KFK09_023807 [Dendrobium nobile]
MVASWSFTPLRAALMDDGTQSVIKAIDDCLSHLAFHKEQLHHSPSTIFFKKISL